MTRENRLLSRVLSVLIVLASCSTASPNVGVFAGSGHTIKLVRSADVQMVSEKVTIVPGRGRFLNDGTVPGMDRVEYRCRFTLKNRSTKDVTIQVGFPLNSQFLGRDYANRKVDATDVVLSYKFIARDQDKTYHVRFSPYDRDQRLAAVFLWDMTFRGGETRELHIAYEMPISMSAASTGRDRYKTYAKHWFTELEGGFVQTFTYVTETSRSWAGSIEQAEFEVLVGGFEKYLTQRRVVEKSEGAEEDASSERGRAGFLRSFRKEWLTHRQIQPDGWTEEDGRLTWRFKGRIPEGGIAVSYLLANVPQTAEALRMFLRSTLLNRRIVATDGEAAGELAKETGAANLPENLADLREILLASWGVAPRTDRVRAFVANQVWYTPRTGATEKTLTLEQKRIVDELDRLPVTMQTQSK